MRRPIVNLLRVAALHHGQHRYLSTYCLHGSHAFCALRCPLCASPCLCECHERCDVEQRAEAPNTL